MASLLNMEHALHPRDNLVGGGIGRLVEVDDTMSNVFADRAATRSTSSIRNRGPLNAEIKHWRDVSKLAFKHHD